MVFRTKVGPWLPTRYQQSPAQHRVWIDGKTNPTDVGTKAQANAPMTENMISQLTGLQEIPIPEGTEVLFGPASNPVRRGNKPAGRTIVRGGVPLQNRMGKLLLGACFADKKARVPSGCSAAACLSGY